MIWVLNVIWLYGHWRQMATKAQTDAKNQQQRGKIVLMFFVLLLNIQQMKALQNGNALNCIWRLISNDHLDVTIHEREHV